jgi:hypothetical protein
VILDVATRPVLKPSRWAASKIDPTGFRSSSTAMARIGKRCGDWLGDALTSVISFDATPEGCCRGSRVSNEVIAGKSSDIP